MVRKIISPLYTLIVVCIGFATVIEKWRGTDFVDDYIYGAWWFSALWAVLTMASLAYMMKQRLYKRVAVMLLHLSFVVILAGALVTHLTARRDTVHLRTQQTQKTNQTQTHPRPLKAPSGSPKGEGSNYSNGDDSAEELSTPLPLGGARGGLEGSGVGLEGLVGLKEFRIVNYPGTDVPLDYESVISLADGGEAVVSMNHIVRVDGYRLFLQSYDSDGQGVLLGVSYDPYGVAITYVGYLLLLAGIIATLLSRHTQMRVLYRKVKALPFCLFVLLPLSASASPLPVVDKDIAHRVGTIHVLYNDRICPLNTVATDFVTKLTGSATWQGYSADEVFVSWMIYYSPWEKELLPAGGDLESTTGELQKLRERMAVVEMFYQGEFLKIFPSPLTTPQGGKIWYSPGSQVLPKEIPVKEQFFIKQSMDFLTESIVTGQKERAFDIIAKIKLFQREMAGDGLPGESKTKAEIFYNSLRSHKWPVFLALTLSLLLCIAMLFVQTRQQIRGRLSDIVFRRKIGSENRPLICLICFTFSLFVYVTLQLGLRWWLSGHVPVSNGPETMLFMAWVLLLLPIVLGAKVCLRRKQDNQSSPFILHLSLAFGPLVASFCLLVAMLGGGGTQLTPLMPVLQSPLLSVHVMTVMCAYALFDLQMLLGIYALLLARSHNPDGQLERITALSQLLLYPAVFLLTIGIFLGAVWANVSWGNYWSWDPKESWALITLMVYAVPFHKTSVGIFNKPRFYHSYMVAAFLTVVITYFGVNYLLGGMHSYA